MDSGVYGLVWVVWANNKEDDWESPRVDVAKKKKENQRILNRGERTVQVEGRVWYVEFGTYIKPWY